MLPRDRWCGALSQAKGVANVLSVRCGLPLDGVAFRGEEPLYHLSSSANYLVSSIDRRKFVTLDSPSPLWLRLTRHISDILVLTPVMPLTRKKILLTKVFRSVTTLTQNLSDKSEER
jgi:hypothetical protein